MKKIITLLLFLQIVVQLPAQPWPLPELPDTISYGRFTSRTLHLLQASTAEKPNTVKILVYGQSISVQDWWLQVKKAIETRFPNANLIMENRAIGGFSSQILYKTVEMDVSTFYPDLVLLHIYGSHIAYDSVLHTIRSRTVAEVAIQTDHFAGENAWSDTMSYHFLPALAEKYKCDLINIRDPWKKYLVDNKLTPKDLLKDDIHLNKHGEFLMAELIKPLFRYKPEFEPDLFGLCTVYKVGKDFEIKNGKIEMPFIGNKVDLVLTKTNDEKLSKAEVLLDGKRPSTYQGTYFMTRPYSAENTSWPWTLPAMIRVGHETQWIEEEWTCKFTEVIAPYEDFSFEISGSVTGKDGSGKGSEDFVSPSKRVIISKGDAEKGGDWHLNRSFKVMKTTVNAESVVKWKTFSMSADTIVLAKYSNSKEENVITLFQGVPNTKHVLIISNLGKERLPVTEIRVYHPFYNR
ncbi:MAG: SGNH/GDSL hydrolase family protein [Draconibacterium sp.]|nr:SGNH/GDSL hydrolase family protein [Draconibacterium sp.]